MKQLNNMAAADHRSQVAMLNRSPPPPSLPNYYQLSQQSSTMTQGGVESQKTPINYKSQKSPQITTDAEDATTACAQTSSSDGQGGRNQSKQQISLQKHVMPHHLHSRTETPPLPHLQSQQNNGSSSQLKKLTTTLEHSPYKPGGSGILAALSTAMQNQNSKSPSLLHMRPTASQQSRRRLLQDGGSQMRVGCLMQARQQQQQYDEYGSIGNEGIGSHSEETPNNNTAINPSSDVLKVQNNHHQLSSKYFDANNNSSPPQQLTQQQQAYYMSNKKQGSYYLVQKHKRKIKLRSPASGIFDPESAAYARSDSKARLLEHQDGKKLLIPQQQNGRPQLIDHYSTIQPQQQQQTPNSVQNLEYTIHQLESMQTLLKQLEKTVGGHTYAQHGSHINRVSPNLKGGTLVYAANNKDQHKTWLPAKASQAIDNAHRESSKDIALSYGLQQATNISIDKSLESKFPKLSRALSKERIPSASSQIVSRYKTSISNNVSQPILQNQNQNNQRRRNINVVPLGPQHKNALHTRSMDSSEQKVESTIRIIDDQGSRKESRYQQEDDMVNQKESSSQVTPKKVQKGKVAQTSPRNGKQYQQQNSSNKKKQKAQEDEDIVKKYHQAPLFSQDFLSQTAQKSMQMHAFNFAQSKKLSPRALLKKEQEVSKSPAPNIVLAKPSKNYQSVQMIMEKQESKSKNQHLLVKESQVHVKSILSPLQIDTSLDNETSATASNRNLMIQNSTTSPKIPRNPQQSTPGQNNLNPSTLNDEQLFRMSRKNFELYKKTVGSPRLSVQPIMQSQEHGNGFSKVMSKMIEREKRATEQQSPPPTHHSASQPHSSKDPMTLSQPLKGSLLISDNPSLAKIHHQHSLQQQTEKNPQQRTLQKLGGLKNVRKMMMNNQQRSPQHPSQAVLQAYQEGPISSKDANKPHNNGSGKGSAQTGNLNISQHSLSKTDIILENDDVKEDNVYNFIKKVSSSKHESSHTLQKGMTEFSRTIADVYKSFNENLGLRNEGMNTPTIEIQNDINIVNHNNNTKQSISQSKIFSEATQNGEKSPPIYYNFGLQKPVIGPFLLNQIPSQQSLTPMPPLSIHKYNQIQQIGTQQVGQINIISSSQHQLLS